MKSSGRYSLRVAAKAAAVVVAQAEYFEERENRRLAVRWQIAVDDTILSLRDMPERGTPCEFRRGSQQGLRRIPISGFEKYLVFYLVDVKARRVFIVAVPHVAQDAEAILAKPQT